MNSVKKPNKKTAVLIAVIIAAAILAAVLIIVLPMMRDDTSDGQSSETVPTESVLTPYGELKYPSMWKDQMTYKGSSENGISSYVFYAVIGDGQYELYTVYFGQSDAGNLLGYIPSDGGDLPVYIECHNIVQSNDLTDSELRTFYSMMEGVNELAQSVTAMSGFYKP